MTTAHCARPREEVRIARILIAGALLLRGAACGSDAGPSAGTEGGPCYPNGTCNTGLVCLSGLCVDPYSCTAGASQPCLCSSGAWGTQACSAFGTWGECDCEGQECVPGSSGPCSCVGGAGGARSCGLDGQWGPCACGGCGNGSLDDGEACDGTNLGALTCSGLGFVGGSLQCTERCTYDLSGCLAPTSCGNGTIEPPEACDGDDLGPATCQSLGFEGGLLRCLANCSYDPSGCAAPPACGDGSVDSDEACDDGNTAGADGCSANCTVEVGWECTGEPSACTTLCGNGVVDPGETCDGANLSGQDCTTLGQGFTEGTLACNPDCTDFDSTGCVQGLVLVEGVVWSPGADLPATLEVNRFPIPNVRVSAYATPPAPLPEGSYCNTCASPLAGVPTTLSDPVDGSFQLMLSPDTSFHLTLEIGNFRRVREITTPTSGALTFVSTPGSVRPSEVTLPSASEPLLGDQVPRIAVVSANYEDLDLTLNALGLAFPGQDVVEVQPTIVNNTAALASHHVLIVPCGENWPGGNGATLRAWVEAGGTLWVDDFNYDFVELPFPEFLSFYDGSSECGTPSLPSDGFGRCNNWSSYDFTGSFPDPDLAAWMALPTVNQGSSPYIQAAWDYIYGLYPGLVGVDLACGTGPNGEVYRQPDVIVRNSNGAPFDASPPAMVSFPMGCGRVVYTVFHTHSGYETPYELLLQEKLFVNQLLQAQACRGGICP